MRWAVPLAASLLVLTGCGGESGGGDGSADDYPSQSIEIMAPADPGGGYDQTARSIGRSLDEGGVIDTGTEVYNVPGASGTAGLTQFVGENTGNPHQLMVIGKILVGAIEQTDSEVELEDTTPIARLTAEYDAVVVPADSEYETLEELMDAFEADPGGVAWGGGSVGGVDQILVAQLAESVGIEPAEINYIPYSGGGELTPAILSGDVTAAASGLAEFQDEIDAGDMRLLAVSSEEVIEGVDAPTIMDAGYDVSIANWRGVVAPPEISDEQRDAVVSMIEDMHDTPEWQETLESNNWDDFLLTGEEFGEYIDAETEDITQTLTDLGIVD
ncbi:tripartite tricarboxylate transporter substrate binding protein [Arthrobacter echini]|uniref:Tripartite tricarboxylate transporter substrate binding protein n=1 Tax=Arthrobacter echini TaxID=1529066 RepID=A0A4V3Z5D6_9MICC|nr:tripartite tricarboxylate transporter substrate-binding protein [Arthrobacter echini]THJ65859.1 tripartite tricarboxylate transporter substrate binding protein [Arthrobacter echini]